MPQRPIRKSPQRTVGKPAVSSGTADLQLAGMVAPKVQIQQIKSKMLALRGRGWQFIKKVLPSRFLQSRPAISGPDRVPKQHELAVERSCRAGLGILMQHNVRGEALPIEKAKLQHLALCIVFLGSLNRDRAMDTS